MDQPKERPPNNQVWGAASQCPLLHYKEIERGVAVAEPLRSSVWPTQLTRAAIVRTATAAVRIFHSSVDDLLIPLLLAQRDGL